MDKRFDQLFNFLWAVIGIFTAMTVSVFGFAFWDRKLSLAPIKKENLERVDFKHGSNQVKGVLNRTFVL